MISRTSHTVLSLGLFFSLCATLIKGDYPYAVLLATVVCLGLIAIVRLPLVLRSPIKLPVIRAIKKSPSIEFVCLKFLANSWWLILISWFFGVSNALLSGVDASLALRNFFGMIVYCIFPILFFISISTTQIIRIVVFAGLVQGIYLISLLIDSANIFLSGIDFKSLSDLRVAYNTGTTILFPLLAISAASVFYPRWGKRDGLPGWEYKFISSRTSLGLLLAVIIIPSMSKGFILASFLILIVVLIFALIEYRWSVRLIAYLIFFCTVIFGWIIIPQEWLDVVSFTFSSEETSNYLRNEQAQYIMDEFTFFGAGLGSSLNSGYVRDDSGYGFELNYLNLIHKLGIFALPIFFSYIATVAVSLYRIRHRSNLLESYFAFGLMGFLIPGIGNPVLLSSTSVLLHSFAIYVLLSPSKLSRENTIHDSVTKQPPAKAGGFELRTESPD
ncbi:MAG: hypothetical protein Q8L68_04085, partial [Methylococcales bacterium]|nr:hypothetical protein [Methylococcales bacterium]